MAEIASEYSFRSWFSRCPLIGPLVLHASLWRDLAFYLVSSFTHTEPAPQPSPAHLIHTRGG